jgi:hypothetical protein
MTPPAAPAEVLARQVVVPFSDHADPAGQHSSVTVQEWGNGEGYDVVVTSPGSAPPVQRFSLTLCASRAVVAALALADLSTPRGSPAP